MKIKILSPQKGRLNNVLDQVLSYNIKGSYRKSSVCTIERVKQLKSVYSKQNEKPRNFCTGNNLNINGKSITTCSGSKKIDVNIRKRFSTNLTTFALTSKEKGTIVNVRIDENEEKYKEGNCFKKNNYGIKVMKLLFRLSHLKKRDVEKIKRIVTYICNNVEKYNLKELTKILWCFYFFGVILKNDDIHKLVNRIKTISFNKHNIHILILNLLRLHTPKEHVNKQLIVVLNNLINNLILRALNFQNFSTYWNYVYFVTELQMYFHNDISSWLNKEYINDSVLTFLQIFQCRLLWNKMNIVIHNNTKCNIFENDERRRVYWGTEFPIDFDFVNEVFDMLKVLNCKVSNLQIYNYFVPLYIKDFNLIIECISEKNRFLDSSLVFPYVLYKYNLFKSMKYKVLLLNKQLMPEKTDSKIAYLKYVLYEALN